MPADWYSAAAAPLRDTDQSETSLFGVALDGVDVAQVALARPRCEEGARGGSLPPARAAAPLGPLETACKGQENVGRVGLLEMQRKLRTAVGARVGRLRGRGADEGRSAVRWGGRRQCPNSGDSQQARRSRRMRSGCARRRVHDGRRWAGRAVDHHLIHRLDHLGERGRRCASWSRRFAGRALDHRRHHQMGCLGGRSSDGRMRADRR
jgi:hypothetical protein